MSFSPRYTKKKSQDKLKKKSKKMAKIKYACPVDEYPVESITGREIRNDVVFYQIKWAEYDGPETWEPIWNCANCLESIIDFEESRFREIGPVTCDARIAWVFSNDVVFFLNAEGTIIKISNLTALRLYPNYLSDFYKYKERFMLEYDDIPTTSNN